MKSRFIDRFEYTGLSGDNILHLRFEVLMHIFVYLDFKSLYHVLTSCNLLHEKYWKQNKEFWFNIYRVRFGKPMFSASVGNWAKIYQKKLVDG
mmetsp:Transcript_11011/g.12381  ORF Transcript_11011/g.12381 Transcript_11011/m.12381 type:complete len:93 (+) Transcript_11011:347-625(+)